MLEKEFVPHQESSELKELGFNEPCLKFYATGKLILGLDAENGDTNSKLEGYNPLYVSAPTFSQAFRFFREKYDLRIRNYLFGNYSGEISEGFEIFKYSKDTIDRIEALTYEEAELACLKKLIEIAKGDNK